MMAARSILSLPGPTLYRIDPATGEERMVARYRPAHRCRSCRSSLSAGMFGASRILKRDYECHRCHALRCARERLMGRRRRRPKEPTP